MNLYEFVRKAKDDWPNLTEAEREDVSRRVWKVLEEDTKFTEGMRRAEADFEAGRGWVYTPEEIREGMHRTGRPHPDWKPDDPIQPEGWHHDGEKWVKD